MKGYMIDPYGLSCSRVIDNCDKYKNGYECEICQKGYIQYYDLDSPYLEVKCVPH